MHLCSLPPLQVAAFAQPRWHGGPFPTDPSELNQLLKQELRGNLFLLDPPLQVVELLADLLHFAFTSGQTCSQ